MSADWTIKIIKSGSGAAFVPDFPGAKQGQPLNATQDDLVTWQNMTDDDHQPWQTNSSYAPNAKSNLSAVIPAGQSSDSYDCASPSAKGPAPQSWTIYYYCKKHPDNPKERGTINVVAAATNGVNILTKGSGAKLDPKQREANPNDRINWNNTTKVAHQPWPTDATYKPLAVAKGSPQYISDVIAPGQTSLTYLVAEPAGNPTPGTWKVYYCCKLHPTDTGERGTINVTPSS
jgi:hypothetical protein